MAYFDDDANNTGALTTRLSTEASSVQGVSPGLFEFILDPSLFILYDFASVQATGARIGTMFQSLASVGTGIIIGFVYSWKLTLLILGFMPFIVASGYIQMQVMSGFSGKGQEALEAAGKASTEAVENIRTVASLTREPTFIKRYEEMTLQPHKYAIPQNSSSDCA